MKSLNLIPAQPHRPRPASTPGRFQPLVRRVTAPVFLCALALWVLASGCTSTKTTSRERLVTEKLPKPDHILVHDFIASAADLPPGSSMAGQFESHPKPQSPEDLEEGRKLGVDMAGQLVDKIRALGMPAARAGQDVTPRVNDIVIHGYLVAIHEGSAAKRVTIGFGSGASQLKTVVEGFQVTAQGMRKLGSGTVEAGGSKTPGAALGLATMAATSNPAGLIVSSGMKIYGEASGKSKVEGRGEKTVGEIAEALEKRFRDEGWIK